MVGNVATAPQCLFRQSSEGRWSYYALNPDAFAQLQAVVGDLPSTRLSVLAERCCAPQSGAASGSGCCG